jgi:hypothetical protein
MNRIWEQAVKQDPNTRLIPAIVPLAIFHGGKGWSAPIRFINLIDLESRDKQELAAYMPDFGFLLDDLSGQSDEQLRARAITQLGLLTLLSLK